MATDSDMAHLVAAVRALLQTCDREPLEWFERLDAPMPSALDEEGNAVLEQFYALAEFDPLSALADRPSLRKSTEFASRREQKSAAHSARLTSYSSRIAPAINAAPAPPRTPLENFRVPDQPSREAGPRSHRSNETPATHLPQPMASERPAGAGDTTGKGNTAAATLFQQATPPTLSNGGAAAFPASEAHAITDGRTGVQHPTALASRRMALARQRTLQRTPAASSLIPVQQRAVENTDLAIAATSSSPTAPVATSATSHANPRIPEHSPRLAGNPLSGLTVDHGPPADGIEAHHTRAPRNPQLQLQSQRVHDDTPAPGLQASGDDSDALRGAANVNEIRGREAACSTDIAAQLADAAYRHGIDLS